MLKTKQNKKPLATVTVLDMPDMDGDNRYRVTPKKHTYKKRKTI